MSVRTLKPVKRWTFAYEIRARYARVFSPELRLVVASGPFSEAGAQSICDQRTNQTITQERKPHS